MLRITRFTKLDGPPRLDALETVLPQVLAASLFRYRWLQVSFAEAEAPRSPFLNPSALQGRKTVPTFALEGTFVAFEDKIRVDVTLKDVPENVVSTAGFRDFEAFGEDSILGAADRLGKRVAEALQAKLSSPPEGHRIRFVIAPALQGKGGGADYASLGPLLSSALFSQLSAAKLANVSFRRGGTGAESGATKSDAVVTGEYEVSGNGVLATARIQERSGAEFRAEARDSLDQVPRLAAALTKGLLEIIRGRVTPEGKWRPESISLLNAKPEEYLAEAKRYEQSKELAPAIVMYHKAIETKPDYIEARSGLAELYMGQGEYEGAISVYQNILQQDSHQAKALYGLGAAYLKSGKYQDAIQQLEEAQRIGVNDPQVQVKLCLTLGDAYLLSRRQEDAIQEYLRGLKMSGDSPEFYHALAKAYRATENLPRAIEYLNKARALYPNDPEFVRDLASTFNEQGRHYYELQKYEEAVVQYEKTLALHSSDPQLEAEAYGYRGAIVGHFLAQPDRQKGIADLKRSVELDASKEWNHRFLGTLYEEAGQYPEALLSLKQAIAIEPTPNSYREMAEVYRLMGNYEAAVESVQQAFKLRPDYAYGYSELALIYESKKDPDAAIESLNKYLEQEPKNQWAYRELGMIYQNQMNDLKKAVENLQKVAELGPTASAYTELGAAYLQNKDYPQAIRATEQALKIDRAYRAAYENLEQIYNAQGKQNQFIQEMERVVEADPKFAWGHAKLGEAYSNSNPGRYDDAIKSLKRAVELDPKDRWARELLGMVYFLKADYDGAKETLEASVAVSPTEWAYTELGKVYLKKLDYDRAMESLKQALKMNAEYREAYDTLESLYTAMNKPQAFAELLEEAVKSHPDFAWAYTKLARNYENEGDYERATESWEKAAEIKGDNATYKALADAYRSTGKWAKEQEVARKLLELDPKGEDGYFYLAQAYADGRNYDRALEAAQQGLGVSAHSALLLSKTADIYRLKKDYPRAAEYCQKAIDLSPKYFFPYWVLTNTQLEQGAYEKAVVSGQKNIELGGYGFARLAEAYDALNRDREADQAFRDYLEKSPYNPTKNPTILANLAIAYHDYLYRDPSGYKQAYELNRKAYELQPKSLQIRENFAEANLTTERYDEALKLAEEVLRNPALSPDEKLSTKLIAIASLLYKKRNADAFSELGEFVRYYESISQDYERSWSFKGTKNFIAKSSTLGQSEKTLLLNLIQILESPKAEADNKLRQLKESLPSLFQQLQTAAALR